MSHDHFQCHMIKLFHHFRDKGQSKYGILQMQWTTDVPVPVSHDTYPERYSSMSDATSTLGGSSTGTHSIKRPLPSIVHKYANTER